MRRLSILLLLSIVTGGCQSGRVTYVPQEEPMVAGSGLDDKNGGVIAIEHRFGPKKKQVAKPKRGPRF